MTIKYLSDTISVWELNWNFV